MTKPEIKFRGDWPMEIQPLVAEIVDYWAYIIPGWVKVLYVRFESGEGDFAATVRAVYDGRFATITIRPEWLEETVEDRVRDVVHEICHLHVQPMKTVTIDIINGIKDERFKDFAYERWKEAWEGSVEDLAWAFTEMPKG